MVGKFCQNRSLPCSPCCILSHILVELFNMSKEILFSRLLEVPVFKNAWEMCTAKSYNPVSLCSVVSKAFVKLVNNKLVSHLEKLVWFHILSIKCRCTDS